MLAIRVLVSQSPQRYWMVLHSSVRRYFQWQHAKVTVTVERIIIYSELVCPSHGLRQRYRMVSTVSGDHCFIIRSSAFKILIDFMILEAKKLTTVNSCTIQVQSQHHAQKKIKKEERKKYCHCTRFCNKKITQQAQRRHYKQLRPEQLDDAQDSATGTISDSSSYSDKFSSSSANDSDTHEAPPKPSCSSRLNYDGSEEEGEQGLESNDSDGSRRGHGTRDGDAEITHAGSGAVQDSKITHQVFGAPMTRMGVYTRRVLVG